MLVKDYKALIQTFEKDLKGSNLSSRSSSLFSSDTSSKSNDAFPPLLKKVLAKTKDAAKRKNVGGQEAKLKK